MRRREIIVEVAERVNLRQETVDKVLQAFATIAAEALLSGEDVPLGWDLGKLIVKKRNKKKWVEFKPSKAFKEVR
jgi:nucleoid DNA-binding protein